MAKAKETQALLDELANHSIHTHKQLATWLKASAEVLTLRGQQVALVRGLLQASELAEPDPVVAGKLEGLIQQLDAQTRILGNIGAESRGLLTSEKILETQVAELRELTREE